MDLCLPWCGRYVAWGLKAEVAEWGHEIPSAGRLRTALFWRGVGDIEWNRISIFQDVTMRLIAEHLLPGNQCGTTFVQDEIINKVPCIAPPSRRLGHMHHLYVSPHNQGAEALIRELNQALGLEVQVTAQLDLLPTCAHFLVYLTSRTWTSGATSTAFAHEVAVAMDTGIHLLLAHEMEGTNQATRDGCKFDSMFACDEGATPQELLQAGIYTEIAVGLKGKEWREAGRALLASELSKSGECQPSTRASFQACAHPLCTTCIELAGTMHNDTSTLVGRVRVASRMQREQQRWSSMSSRSHSSRSMDVSPKPSSSPLRRIRWRRRQSVPVDPNRAVDPMQVC